MKNNPLKENPLLRLTVCLVVGIVIGDYQPLWGVLPFCFVSLVVITLLLWRHANLQSLAISVCFVLLGWLLLQRQYASLKVDWPDGSVRYEVVVLSEPIEKPKTIAVDVMLARDGRKLKCYFYKDARSRALHVGDGLQIQSRIKPIDDRYFDRFNYRHYLEERGFVGTTFVSSWNWQKAIVSLRDLSYLQRTRLGFLRLRSRILQRLAARSMSDEQYAVVAAMVLGDKSALTSEVRELYSLTGASHVLALSGLHLGIIYTLLSLLVLRRRWQMVSQFLIVMSIWAFVFLTGMSDSLVRSAVMLSVYALLSLGHRDRMSINTLAFTAIVMLMVNPLALFDVGFQLSFMAVFAILLWQPLFERVFPQGYLQRHRLIRWVWAMVSVSCAAQMGVAPLIAYYFGRFSTFFLPTNFIVVPAATLILYLSLIVLVFPPLAYILIYVINILHDALRCIASVPGASIGPLHPTLLQVTMVYVIMASVYLLIIRLRNLRIAV